jgi:hypothetical protein
MLPAEWGAKPNPAGTLNRRAKGNRQTGRYMPGSTEAGQNRKRWSFAQSFHLPACPEKVLQALQ